MTSANFPLVPQNLFAGQPRIVDIDIAQIYSSESRSMRVAGGGLWIALSNAGTTKGIEVLLRFDQIVRPLRMRPGEVRYVPFNFFDVQLVDTTDSGSVIPGNGFVKGNLRFEIGQSLETQYTETDVEPGAGSNGAIEFKSAQQPNDDIATGTNAPASDYSTPTGWCATYGAMPLSGADSFRVLVDIDPAVDPAPVAIADGASVRIWYGFVDKIDNSSNTKITWFATADIETLFASNGYRLSTDEIETKYHVGYVYAQLLGANQVSGANPATYRVRLQRC